MRVCVRVCDRPPWPWQLWADMCRGAAMAFAAALPRCAEVMEGVRPPAHSCFQFFGLDFLVDAAAR